MNINKNMLKKISSGLNNEDDVLFNELLNMSSSMSGTIANNCETISKLEQRIDELVEENNALIEELEIKKTIIVKLNKQIDNLQNYVSKFIG